MRRYVERDLWLRRLEVCTEVGCLHRPHAHAIQWRIVERLYPEHQRRHDGGIALQVLKSRGRDDRSPLSSPRKPAPIAPAAAILVAARARKTAESAELGLLKAAIGIGSAILSIYLRFIPAGHVRSCRPDMHRCPGYP